MVLESKDHVARYECRVYDAKGNLKYIIPQKTVGQVLKEKMPEKFYRQSLIFNRGYYLKANQKKENGDGSERKNESEKHEAFGDQES